MKDVLVCLNGTAGDEAAMTLAVRLVRPCGGHVTCIHVVPNARSLLRQAISVDMLASTLPADALRTLEARAHTRSHSARMAFATFGEGNKIDLAGVTTEFLEVAGDPLEEVLRRVRFHDVVIAEGSSRHGGASPQDELARLIVEAGRPILLATRDTSHTESLKIVTIAWRSGAESARAVAASMSLLVKAESVHLLSAAETSDEEALCREDLDDLARHLSRHGIQATPRLVAVHGNVCDSVLSAAQALRSDLLVMGAYGHGRLRELVLGGFTQRVLDGVSLPVFLVH